MAFGDYGGRAYRNGVPVQDRDEAPLGHSVLGDGPVFLVLYKQVAMLVHGADKNSPIERSNAAEERHTIELDGHTMEVVYTQEDNHYVYGKLAQPDGVQWHGWSGYGVGLDDTYGYSTSDRDEKLQQLWPGSIQQ